MPQSLSLWYRQFGAPDAVLSLEERSLAERNPGHIRVRMSAAPINPSDLIPITGAYRHRVQPPMIAGYEGVGTVVEAPPHGPYKVGQRVLPLRGAGTWQSHVDCDPAFAVPVPEDIDDDLALRAYINPLAAFLMLRRFRPAGRTVLLTAASSTCAGLLTQWCLAAGARSVIGIHRSPHPLKALQASGMTLVQADDRETITAFAKTSDLVFDAVGGGLATRILASLRPDATVVSYGLLSGELPVFASGGPMPQRFHIRDHLAGVTPGLWQDWFAAIWPLLRAAHLPPVARFPVADWRQALANFYTPGRRSKPVLVFDP
ncbi:NADPH:quinone reductase-like Zn-dependent oxidoreductase [Neorhizobium galegae]|uniref:zinc-dependent alcohol dehydrogenase family protein n=1 Tax=Neorhizobium galegae TaxID=399 RepID=UPI001AE8D9F7|nr:NADPH:quinone reductase-like Zn-dependent oxidoreductase [Neorhizobium galegae]